MKHALLILAMLIGTAAQAGEEWNPPARYDHAYAGELRVYHVAPRLIPSYCAALLESVGLYNINATRGCAAYQGNECIVIIPDRFFRRTAPSAVLRHEVGHCNGWPEDHPE